MMKNIKKITNVSAASLLVLSLVFTGCGTIKKSSSINYGKGEKTSTVETRVIEQEKIYQIGDTVDDASPTKDNPDNISLEYTMKDVKIYDTPEEANIDRDSMCEAYGMSQLSEEGGKLEIDKNKILVCNMTIKNINAGVEELRLSDLTLLSRLHDSDKVDWTWDNPAYFSNPKNPDPEKKDYFSFTLSKGESMEVQVAWLVDPSKIELGDLYLAINYPAQDCIERFIRLYPND